MIEFNVVPLGASFYEIIFRLILAAVLGGVIGLERATRRQVSGFRTFALLCVGSALTMIVSIYLVAAFDFNDPTRLPGQAITGIGFLGVGTIFQTGRGQVRGMTTAAALWSVCALGIAVGAGLYICSLTVMVLIIFINHVLVYVSHYQEKMNREIEFYVELKKGKDIENFVTYLRESEFKIKSIRKSKDVLLEDAVGLQVQMNFEKRLNHEEFLENINKLKGVYYIEEI